MRKLLAFLGWLWGVVLVACYAAVAACIVRILVGWPMLLVFVPVFAVLLAGIIIGRFVLVKNGWDKYFLIRAAALLLLTLPLALLSVDAPPLENDYTEADVRPHDPAVLASYDTLMKFRRDGGILVQRTFPKEVKNDLAVIADPLPHAAVIRQAWDELGEARKVIVELDQFPGITDIGKDTRFSPDIPIVSFLTLRSTSRRYAAYARLKVAEGDTQEAARQVAQLHRVARKSLPHSHMMVTKMTWVAIAKLNIQTADVILRSPHCDAATLAVLKENFMPLAQEELSMRPTGIYNYFFTKTLLDEWRKKEGGMSLMHKFEMTSPPRFELAAVERPIARLGEPFLLRRNRTLRDLRYLFDMQMEDLSTMPCGPDRAIESTWKLVNGILDGYCEWPGQPVEPAVISRLWCYNMEGRMLACLAVPSVTSAGRAITVAKVQSDLLYLDICKRLGEVPELPDPYTQKPYASDARGRLFSAGPDGKSGTDDDIWADGPREKKPLRRLGGGK